VDNYQINQRLISGELRGGVLPHVDNLKTLKFIFEQNFGLSESPTEPGVLLVRGPQQYGKSTWLEQQVELTIKKYGKGTALYLNGDEITNHQQLMIEIRTLIGLFSKSNIKRLFIDEITAVQDWQKTIKRLVDAGELKDVLLITTGSKSSDLRRGVEQLPGRKGKLERTSYIFTPVSYRHFKKICGDFFKSDSLYAYILSGGSPIGINALATIGKLPEYVIEIISDWVFGEFSANGRSRAHLLAVLQSLYRMACTPIGQAKLARESGLSNNTAAQGYIKLLADLMAVAPAFPFDLNRNISIFRKPCKYHFTNLLVALCWHPQKPRSIEELKNLGQDLGSIFEWTVAQELWRRLCIEKSQGLPQHLDFWQSKEHEIDFILPEEKHYIEVKSGKTQATDFIWFLKSFPHQNLTVISQSTFETERIKGITLEQFLLGAD
jgi:predicted AAA+ superfamily ATPase